MSPPSIPFPFSTSLCTLTPVVESPFAIVHCIGAAPLYRGNREGWTLSRLSGSKWDKNELGIMWPKEAVTRILSGFDESNGVGRV